MSSNRAAPNVKIATSSIPLAYTASKDNSQHFADPSIADSKLFSSVVFDNKFKMKDNDVFVRGGTTDVVTFESVKTLRPEKWLNDEVLHFFTHQFGELFALTVENDHTAFFGSFFFDSVTSSRVVKN